MTEREVGDGSTERGAPDEPVTRPVLPTFDEVYETHVDYLWRSARALGVAPSGIDDVLQDVFLVVHRRLHEFEGRAAVRTWLTRILMRVVAERRRRFRRKEGSHTELAEDAIDSHVPTPHDELARTEAVRLLASILDAMDDDQRTVFVLAEIEQIPVPEIAEALQVNVNTVYSRLRLARKDYEKHLARLRAKDDWRQR